MIEPCSNAIKRIREIGALKSLQPNMNDERGNVVLVNSVDEAAIVLEEYKALKAEQIHRIAARDNLVYLTLAIVAGLATLAFKEGGAWLLETLLVVPWACVFLGWNYLMNDQKISAIGKYVRGTIDDRLKSLVPREKVDADFFGWETAHRSDSNRSMRKAFQLLIDLFVFVVTGLGGIGGYLILSPGVPFAAWVFAVFTGGALIVLAVQFMRYSDAATGK